MARRTMIGLGLAIAAGTAGAQQPSTPMGAMTPAPACTTGVKPAAPYAGFDSPIQTSNSGTILVGHAATLPLGPGMQFPVAPGHTPGAGTFGGLVRFDVGTGGTYRVALGQPLWIDMVRDGAALSSTAHGHGPDCTGIRKIVDFVLKPGRYTLQLSGATVTRATVMVVEV